MDIDMDIPLVEVPDLSRQIKLSRFKPHFNGNYSSVYQAIFQDQLVAVKVIKEIPGALVHTIERKLKRERTTWALLRHPNILPLLGFANDHELFEPFGALISPWRAQGNACIFLKDRGKDLTKAQRLNMWKGVVEGVQYLHNHTPVLVHGDLKLANIMIDDQYSPQICDFGLVSIFLEEGHSGMTTTSQYTGTDRYLAYELICDEDTITPTVASDVFALGCIGLEFYFLQTPYANRRNNMQGRIFADIKAGIRPANPQPGCDPESQGIWNLLGQCWEHNPSQRPSAGDLLAALQFRGDDAQLSNDSSEGLKPPKMHSNTLTPRYAMNFKFGIRQEEDSITQGDGPGHKLSKTLPSANGHRQTVRARVTGFAVEDWSDRAQVQSDHPRLVGTQSYQVPPAVSHGAAPLPDNYVTPQQSGLSVYAISGHQSNTQPPPLWTYPPLNPVPDLPSAGPSNSGRNNSNSKQKQQGQRNEVDERKLAEAFMQGSFRNDPALRFFLNVIRTYSFYLEDEPEPLVGTPEAEQLFAEVRGRYPHDPRFASRNDSRFPLQPIDNETRDSQSIFLLLTENNQCLLCGAQKDQTQRALGHVRSDIGHRPYHCTCEKCMQSANPRRFFTENLLDDHLKGQQIKQECVYCHNLFRRGGMKRHLMSKHPDHAQGAQGNRDNDDHRD